MFFIVKKSILILFILNFIVIEARLFAGSNNFNCGFSKLLQTNRKKIWGKTSLPQELNLKDQQKLIEEFVNDGRDILVFSDSWESAGSGISTVMIELRKTISKLTDNKVNLRYVTPQDLPAMRLPFQDYGPVAEFAKASGTPPALSRKAFDRFIKEINPQAIHLMTERPMGLQALKYLRDSKIPFSTAFHTELSKYVGLWLSPKSKVLGATSEWLVAKILRYFHSKGKGVMVPTQSMINNLLAEGYNPKLIRSWSHGVDLEKFRPDLADLKLYEGLPRPISLYVGRVETEKNLDDYLSMNVPGTKVIVGDGASMKELQAKYPSAVFLGRKPYADIPKYMASADKFIFPSLTDTYGLVQIEAIATGVPVVGYKVQGPIDVVTSKSAGRLADYDPNNRAENIKRLEKAWHETDAISKQDARKFAESHSWERTSLEFLHFLERIPPLNR